MRRDSQSTPLRLGSTIERTAEEILALQPAGMDTDDETDAVETEQQDDSDDPRESDCRSRQWTTPFAFLFCFSIIGSITRNELIPKPCNQFSERS